MVCSGGTSPALQDACRSADLSGHLLFIYLVLLVLLPQLVPLSVYQSSSHECLKRTSETSLDANRIHVCETSPEAFPPVMRFADAPNETSPQRKAFVCKSDGGRPCRHHRDPPMQPLRPPPWRGKHGNEITEEGKSHLFVSFSADVRLSWRSEDVNL